MNHQHYAGLMHKFVITTNNIANTEEKSEQLNGLLKLKIMQVMYNHAVVQLSNDLSAENSTSTITSTSNKPVIENKESDPPAEIETNEQQSIDMSAKNFMLINKHPHKTVECDFNLSINDAVLSRTDSVKQRRKPVGSTGQSGRDSSTGRSSRLQNRSNYPFWQLKNI